MRSPSYHLRMDCQLKLKLASPIILLRKLDTIKIKKGTRLSVKTDYLRTNNSNISYSVDPVQRLSFNDVE